MKKALIFIIILLISSTLFTGCKKWLDVNNDPNNMVEQPSINEAVYLLGVESEWVRQSVVEFSWWIDAEETQWLLWEAMPGANSSSFIIGANFGNNVWNTYTGSLKHAVNLYDLAKGNGNKRYQAIAGTIAAWNWFYLADMYDKAPLDEALKGYEFPHPKVATQEEIYAHGNALLDEAITLFQDPDPGTLVPGNDDYMMGGNAAKWIKLCYSLKARYAMRLTYAPGKTKAAQADLVLSYLANGMTSNSDECKWIHLSDKMGNCSWAYRDYLQAYTGGKGQVAGIWLVDLMNSLNDPRRYEIFTFCEADPTGFEGLQSGNVWATGHEPSYYRLQFLWMTHPDYIMRYPECLFLKAEAYALKGDWANAQTALDAAVTADMSRSAPLDFPEAMPQDSIDKYLAQPALTIPANEEGAQELIITQKYLAGIYNSNEAYFDYIRTGYPQFDFIYALRNVTTGVTFPRRNLYPANTFTDNENIKAIGQSDPMEGGTTWDAKPGIGPRAK